MRRHTAPLVLVVIMVGLVVLILAGPRAKTTDNVSAPEIGADPSGYLAESESRLGDITTGAEKRIVWHDRSSKRPTPFSIVYIHGFSASRAESAPLCDSLASRLGANLFYTRLSGHGRPGQKMGQAEAADWFQDALEAVEIGRRIGGSVILIGSSTGATLVDWLITSGHGQGVGAAILMSPNYGPKDSRAAMLLWPWGRQIALLVEGNTYEWVAHNRLQERYWSTNYPTSALLEMMALVELVREIPAERNEVATLVLFSTEDAVVDVEAIKFRFEGFSSRIKRRVEIDTDDPSGHVLAGDILSPSTTEEVADLIESFVLRSKEDPGWSLTVSPASAQPQ